MGSNAIVHKTICAVGCLLTSTTMVLRSKGIQIDGEDATPARLNAWLQTHGGYDDDDDLDEAVVAKIDPRLGWTNESKHTKPDVAWATLVAMLAGGAPVIANVMKGRHFVLVVAMPATATRSTWATPACAPPARSPPIGWLAFIM